MLSKIFIQNFALIDSVEIALGKGLQVITGETGAGKSIILGALRLILGERADAKSIQDTGKKSVVEAEFSLNDSFRHFFEENDLDFDNQTVIRREIQPSGKSRAFINDVPVTLETLKMLSQKLIDIHSQFETSNLFEEEYQFRIIDALSENKVLIAEYQNGFSELKKLTKRLELLNTALSEGNKEADYRTFLLNELEEMTLEEIDLEDLQDQLNTQENLGAISENLSHIFSRTDADEVGIIDALVEVRSKLSRTAELSHHFSKLSQRLDENFLEFRDIILELSNEAEHLDPNPQLIETLNTKINQINALFLKHQVNSVEGLIEIRENLSSSNLSLLETERQIAETKASISGLENRLNLLTDRLSENRRKAAPVFTKKTETLLRQLGLEKAKIEVALEKTEHFSPFGKDSIQLLFQANAGFPLKPIQAAISGGERSRVMLSIKKILAENAALPTLILDEIDTGVSGKVAEEMGNVMREMSGNMQLIVITHLAQVAAKGHDNYKVVKKEVLDKTQTNIISLGPEEKLQEIAQLLSGSKITEAAVSQAKELMKI